MFKPDAEGTGVIINENGVVIELNEDELLEMLYGLQYAFADRFDKPATAVGSLTVNPVDFGRPRPRLVDQAYLEKLQVNTGESHAGDGERALTASCGSTPAQ